MRLLALLIVDTPDIAEVLAVVIETHAGRWARLGMIGNQHLKFKRLLALTDRHDLANPAKKRVISDLDREGQAQVIGDDRGAGDPGLAELEYCLRRADAHEFAHSERLQPVKIQRWLMAEH